MTVGTSQVLLTLPEAKTLLRELEVNDTVAEDVALAIAGAVEGNEVGFGADILDKLEELGLYIITGEQISSLSRAQDKITREPTMAGDRYYQLGPVSAQIVHDTIERVLYDIPHNHWVGCKRNPCYCAGVTR